MNDKIAMLLGLQDKDVQIDKLQEELEFLPQQIETLKKEIDEEKKKFEEYKKENNQKLLAKKQKEGALEQKDSEIGKHNQELNAVKTNEAYRAILKEIEKAKEDKNKLEEEILVLMDEIESFNKDVRQKEQQLKNFEAGQQSKINQQNQFIETKKNELQEIMRQRDEVVKTITPEMLQRYMYIRNAKKGAALVKLDGETCAGCGMKVPPHVITQVYKGAEIVVCEMCARILYTDKLANNAKV